MVLGRDNFEGLGPERLPKERLAVGWPWRLMILGILVLGLTVFVWAGLSFGYKPFLRSQISNLDQEISNLGKVVSPEEQENFLFFYSQIANLSKILKNHIISSKIFSLLEQITNRGVFYNKFGLSLIDRSLSLEGQARSLESLAQQLESFKETPEIEKVFVKEAKLSGAASQFSLKLFLKEDFLKFK